MEPLGQPGKPCAECVEQIGPPAAAPARSRTGQVPRGYEATALPVT